jgi:hypothetical protein
MFASTTDYKDEQASKNMLDVLTYCGIVIHLVVIKH